MVTQNYHDQTSSLMYHSDIHQLKASGKNLVFVNAETRLEIVQTKNQDLAYLNLESEQIYLRGLHLICQPSSQISYNEMIYLEPRISIGN